jgi:lipopolysaccharide biosynthesis regulator YciM
MQFVSESPYFFGIIILLIGFFSGLSLSDLFSPAKKKKDEAVGSDSLAYLSGINYILADEPDKAIEEFSKAVQINSDTVETYTALGNLYRSKGELARAIRIHQSIIIRPNIDAETKLQAHYDLSLDFKKAGFVERAINSFEEVVKMDSRRLDAYTHLLDLYEDLRDWEKAYQTQLKISKLRKSDDSHVLAHHQTEIGKSLIENGQETLAKKALKKAISHGSSCIDAYLHLGDLLFAEENCNKAIDTWKKIMDIAPDFSYLAYSRLEEAYFKLNQFGQMEKILRANSKRNLNDIHTHMALAEYLYKKSLLPEAIAELNKVIELRPAHVKAREMLGKYYMEQGKEADAFKLYQSTFEYLPSPGENYQCSDCGYESRNLAWRCPQCRKWDTMKEKGLVVTAS